MEGTQSARASQRRRCRARHDGNVRFWANQGRKGGEEQTELACRNHGVSGVVFEIVRGVGEAAKSSKACPWGQQRTHANILKERESNSFSFLCLLRSVVVRPLFRKQPRRPYTSKTRRARYLARRLQGYVPAHTHTSNSRGVPVGLLHIVYTSVFPGCNPGYARKTAF